MGAQFTIPLIEVIPGQLIASALWNNEWNNLNSNFVPSGMDSYSDTDSQMQIQTNPYPGSVTSHATSLGGEIERIRYQISKILGATTPEFWYAAPPTDLTTINASIVPVGAVIDFPSATPPTANYLLANGQAIGRSAYATLFGLIGTTFGIGDGTTTFNIPNYTDKMSIAAGNLYALAATGGALTNTPSVSITDPGHNHTQNAHAHIDSGHVHSSAAHTHTVPHAGWSVSGNGSAGILTAGASANSTQTSVDNTSGSTTPGNTGSGSANIQNTTPTNNSNTTGITATSGAVQVLNPYLAMYKMMRVL